MSFRSVFFIIFQIFSFSSDSHQGHDHSSALGGDEASFFCQEHQLPESECGICQPQKIESMEVSRGMKLRLSSKHSATLSGIVCQHPKEVNAFDGFEVFSRVRFNQNRMARISSRVPAIVEKVLVEPGSEVKSGDILAVLHSAVAAREKAQYLRFHIRHQLSHENFQREELLSQKSITAIRERDTAKTADIMDEAELSMQKQALKNLGFSQKEIQEILVSQDTSATILIRAPFDGTIVARNTVSGESVEEGESIFTLANLETMWLELSIPMDHWEDLFLNQPVIARVSRDKSWEITGTIFWISDAIDPQSQMLLARAEIFPHSRGFSPEVRAVASENELLESPSGTTGFSNAKKLFSKRSTNSQKKLKDGLFAFARVQNPDEKIVFSLPSASVLSVGEKRFVFVRLSEDLFELVRVKAGAVKGNMTEIEEGINPGDEIVSEGAFLLFSEIMKSKMGAGCADH